MASGGYHPPRNPAPSSGPGALSRRTDGGPSQPMRDLPGGEYGDGKEFRELQRGAPLPQATPSAAPAPPAPSSAPDVPVVPLNAPSARAGEPVTAGADAGAGPGMDALGLPNGQEMDLAAMKSRLPALELLAGHPGTSKEVRNYVRRLRGMIGT
jgi:hypothetical protein